MNNNENIMIAPASEACVFDTYTEADWDAMYASYLEDKAMGQELPDTKEWGLY